MKKTASLTSVDSLFVAELPISHCTILLWTAIFPPFLFYIRKVYFLNFILTFFIFIMKKIIVTTTFYESSVTIYVHIKILPIAVSL